jgi:hypothetical protein
MANTAAHLVDRVLLLVRDGLVRARTRLINRVRGFAKSLGWRLPSSASEAFPKRVRSAVSQALGYGRTEEQAA